MVKTEGSGPSDDCSIQSTPSILRRYMNNLKGTHIFEYEGNMRIGWYDGVGFYMVLNINEDNECTYETMIGHGDIMESPTREEFFATLKEEFGE